MWKENIDTCLMYTECGNKTWYLFNVRWMKKQHIDTCLMYTECGDKTLILV